MNSGLAMCKQVNSQDKEEMIERKPKERKCTYRIVSYVEEEVGKKIDELMIIDCVSQSSLVKKIVTHFIRNYQFTQPNGGVQ